MQRPREEDGTPPMGRVGMVAGISLGLSDEQATDALNALAGFRPTDATAGALFARMLELVDLARSEGLDDGLPHDLNTAAERAKLDRSFGAGFVKRVTTTGQPAVSMLAALRSLLLLAALLLWPAQGNAAVRAATGLVGTTHKIQRRNFGPGRRRAYHRRRGWIRSKAKSGRSRLRCTSSRASATGSAPERGSYLSKASSSKSSSSGDEDASTSAAFRRATRTLRSNAATGASSSRLTFEARGLQ